MTPYSRRANFNSSSTATLVKLHIHSLSSRIFVSQLTNRMAPIEWPGFTAKGYGGMAGCVIAAVIGLVTIIWYGATDSPAARLDERDVPFSTLRLGDNLEVTEGEGENLAREERRSMSENPEDR